MPNWIPAPRLINACQERWMMKSALFLASVPQAAVTGKRLLCRQVGVVVPMSFLPPLATT